MKSQTMHLVRQRRLPPSHNGSKIFGVILTSIDIYQWPTVHFESTPDTSTVFNSLRNADKHCSSVEIYPDVCTVYCLVDPSIATSRNIALWLMLLCKPRFVFISPLCKLRMVSRSFLLTRFCISNLRSARVQHPVAKFTCFSTLSL